MLRKRFFSRSLARISLLFVVVTSIVVPSTYQPLLNGLYEALKCSKVYQASTFETFWTVFCYAVIEPSLTVVFFRRPEWRLAAHNAQDKMDDAEYPAATISKLPKPKGMRRPSRRLYEAFTYVVPLLLMDLVMIKKFAGVDLEAMLISGNYEPATTLPTGYHRSTFLAPSMHNFSVSSPLQTKRALPAQAPTSRRLVLELICSFVIYDALFFVFHLLMHIVRPLARWHAPHHTHAEINPQITNQLHVFERLGLVLLANFSLNIIRSHVLTRTLFVPIFVWLLVEIHSGLDLPWGYEKILPGGWGGGAKKHALHHKNGGGGLEPFFEWCDGLWNYFALCRKHESRTPAMT
ncbi:MAG: hypothetical protein M1828_004683 [Chrysothrix sp. TS-e1954]|nr:MAG: hypothetical protein M1828_004683 [Chrysothrix sp. TS-e1954]